MENNPNNIDNTSNVSGGGGNPMLDTMKTATSGLGEEVKPTDDDINVVLGENQYEPVDSTEAASGDAATASGGAASGTSNSSEPPMSKEHKAIVAEGFLTGLNDLAAIGAGSLNKYMNDASLKKAKALKQKLFAKLSELTEPEKALLFYCDRFCDECQKQIDSFNTQKALSKMQIDAAVSMAVKIMEENNINPNPWWGLVAVLIVPLLVYFWNAATTVKAFDPASFILQYEQLQLQKAAAATKKK